MSVDNGATSRNTTAPEPLSFQGLALVAGSDLNRRPLGYESPRGCAGNPLISRRLCETASKYRLLADSCSYLVFQDVSGWYGSKTGADDLWVQPKRVLVLSTAGGTETRL